MPWHIWKKIHETGNITLVIKSGETTIFECLNKWYDLKDEWVRKFGLAEDYLELLEAKKQAVLKMCEYLKTGDRFVEFESKMLLLEVGELDKKGNSVNMDEEKALMQRMLGFRINQEWTVDEYYNQKKVLQNG